MELNFYGLVRCTRAAAPLLLERRGHLINIGSLSAKVASRYMGPYAATKFAVAAYSQQLRLELGAKGFSKSQDGVELYAHYYVLATVGTMAQVQGQFVAAVPEWGLPPFTGSTSALSVYPTGTLIIDLTTPDGQIVWRGAAQRKLDLDSSDAERRKILERAIADLFKNFPPKPKK